MKTLSSLNVRQPIQISGKGVTSGFFVTGDGVYNTWDQFIAGVHKVGNIFLSLKNNLNCSCLWGHQQLSQVFYYPNIQCHASKLKRVVVLGGFHWHQQSRANNFLHDFAIINHKTIPTMKVYLYPYIQAINLNLR
jgi:hypothetical protein